MLLAALLAATFIVVLAGFLIERVRKEDEKEGLNIDAKEYSMFGTLKHIFSSPEKRISSELRPSFSGYLKDNPILKKRLRKTTYLSMTACGIIIILGAVFHQSVMYTAIFSVALIFLSYLTGSLLVIIALMFYTILFFNGPLSIVLICADGCTAIVLIFLVHKYHAEYKKHDTAQNKKDLKGEKRNE